MSKIAINHDHREGKRRAAKLHLKQANYRGVPPLERTTKRPAQPTIVTLRTAKQLAYLMHKGLADFSKCKLSVAIQSFTRNGIYHDLRGVPSFGV